MRKLPILMIVFLAVGGLKKSDTLSYATSQVIKNVSNKNDINSYNYQKQKNKRYLLPDTTVDWKELTSVIDLWKAYPGRVQKLLEALDLSRPGLHNVRKCLQAKDTVAAAKALLVYYRKKKPSSFVQSSPALQEMNFGDGEAERILKDTINVRNGPVHIPLRSDGGIEWNYLGPNNDEEFGYNLNKHLYFFPLLRAWQKTHQSKYAKAFDRIIRDWTIHNPLPAKNDSIYKVLSTPTSTLDWRDIGEVRWRTLEAGIRLGRVWPQIFYGFQQAGSFTPGGRLLMLSSLYDHAKYIYQYHEHHHNHALMELNGLAMVALAFSEFKEADQWFQHARKQMVSEIKYLVYPDGISKELTTGYHVVALNSFKRFAEIVRQSNKQAGAEFKQTLEKMYNYLAYSMRPDAHMPLNNDTDRRNVQSMIMKAAQKFNRQDWKWIATNGKEGQKPRGVPSKVFPWAGINIMRSGWGKDAQWAFFDTGPYGTAHQHNDKLHLSVAAYGKDLLVDGGRYTYKNYFSLDPTTWRGYFRSSFSHNVILIDGKGQNAGPTTAGSALKKGVDYINKPGFDYARGTFANGFNGVEGKAIHTRALLYRRGDYWIVVDHITTDRPRKIQVLWHYAPDCHVKIEGDDVASTDPGQGNLRIIPLANSSWDVQIIKGQSKPFKQGWYSSEYGKKQANDVAIYSTKIQKSANFAWVLVPAKGIVEPLHPQLIRADDQEIEMKIKEKGKEAVTITIPIGNKEQPSIRGL